MRSALAFSGELERVPLIVSPQQARVLRFLPRHVRRTIDDAMDQILAGGITSTLTFIPAHNSKLYTASTTHVVPAGVLMEYVFLLAPGGGGGCPIVSTAGCYSGGGGAGQLLFWQDLAVTPGQSITVTLPAGGAGSGVSNTAGTDGPTAVFGSLSAVGGKGGKAAGAAGIAAGGLGGATGSAAGQPGNDVLLFGGDGAATMFGPGGRGGRDNAPSATGAAAFGSGGGGGGEKASNATPRSGGDGGQSLCLVAW